MTTTSALLVLDLATHEVVPVESGRTEYYGVSWFPSGRSLVLSHSGLDNASLVDADSYARSETGWLSNGELSTRGFLSQPHQILCASDGRVVCTNTGRNAITIVDLHRPGHFQEVRFSDERWDRLGLHATAGDHLNSVFERDGSLYVVGHGHDHGSFIAELSYPDLEVCSIAPTEGRTGLHNVWLTGDGLMITCDTNRGALVDLSTNAVLWECVRRDWYARGLAATSDVVLVGESQPAERRGRRSSPGGVWVLDRQRWNAIDYIPLGPYGDVHEIRLLDVPDEAHHGMPFAGLAELLDRDERAIVTSERLATAALSELTLQTWTGFEVVEGYARPDGVGGRVASLDDTCLAVARHMCRPTTVEFEFSMASDDSHVAFSIGGRRSGEDRDMVALLLQSRGHIAYMSVFRQRGGTWVQEEIAQLCEAAGPSRSGRLRLEWNDSTAVVTMNGHRAICVPADRLPPGPTGIRWCGAMVRPLVGGSVEQPTNASSAITPRSDALTTCACGS